MRGLSLAPPAGQFLCVIETAVEKDQAAAAEAAEAKRTGPKPGYQLRFRRLLDCEP
jgi:hypothetical protein